MSLRSPGRIGRAESRVLVQVESKPDRLRRIVGHFVRAGSDMPSSALTHKGNLGTNLPEIELRSASSPLPSEEGNACGTPASQLD